MKLSVIPYRRLHPTALKIVLKDDFVSHHREYDRFIGSQKLLLGKGELISQRIHLGKDLFPLPEGISFRVVLINASIPTNDSDL